MRRAVVDVGSNSVLLTVCERTECGWREVFYSSEVTGLGTDTRKTGLLQEDAQERTLAAIRTAFKRAGELEAVCVAAATMAVRIAKNDRGFLDRAVAQGTPIIVLSGDEEAHFGLEAVMRDPEFALHQTVSVIDPGGHSTELATAVRTPSGFDVAFRKSFPIGALGLREGPMGTDSPDPRARLTAAVELDDALGLEYMPGQAGTAVALGATPTNLVSIRNAPLGAGAEQQIHGQYLDFEEVSRAVAWMCEMTEPERASIPGLERGREKTIHIGALVLERCLNALHVLGCYVSVRGWRHAMLENDVYF
jgi:exopolyphosphatase/guanosine-5'-triphosphate,3'-diphosphate pyrophosphatase